MTCSTHRNIGGRHPKEFAKCIGQVVVVLCVRACDRHRIVLSKASPYTLGKRPATSQPMPRARAKVGQAKLEKVVHAGVLDNQRTVHVGFPKRQIGIECQPPHDPPVDDPYRHQRAPTPKSWLRLSGVMTVNVPLRMIAVSSLVSSSMLARIQSFRFRSGIDYGQVTQVPAFIESGKADCSYPASIVLCLSN